MTKNDGGPAFPQTDLSGYGMGPGEGNNSGMTLRDWFAGQALTGYLHDIQHHKHSEVHIARCSYILADAMLAARESGK